MNRKNNISNEKTKLYNDYLYSLPEDVRCNCIDYFINCKELAFKAQQNEPFTIDIPKEYIKYVELLLEVYGYNVVVKSESCLLVSPTDQVPIKVTKSVIELYSIELLKQTLTNVQITDIL